MKSLRKIFNEYYARTHLTTLNTPVEYYTNLLEKESPFSFSRFGDGEWAAIFGVKGENCDGHTYFPELGQALKECLTNAGDYLYAIQNYALRRGGFAISRFLKKNHVDLRWHNSDVFHYASRDGKLTPLVNAINKLPVVVIGPPHLRDLQGLINYRHFVEIPQKNCFLSLDSIREEVLTISKKLPNAVYSFSASMTANVLVHQLHPHLGKSNWLLDMGSVWDVYVGVHSRGYHRDVPREPAQSPLPSL